MKKSQVVTVVVLIALLGVSCKDMYKSDPLVKPQTK